MLTLTGVSHPRLVERVSLGLWRDSHDSVKAKLLVHQGHTVLEHTSDVDWPNLEIFGYRVLGVHLAKANCLPADNLLLEYEFHGEPSVRDVPLCVFTATRMCSVLSWRSEHPRHPGFIHLEWTVYRRDEPGIIGVPAYCFTMIASVGELEKFGGGLARMAEQLDVEMFQSA